MVRALLCSAFVFLSLKSWAQVPSAEEENPLGGKYRFELGGQVGKLLPDQIGGVTEILPQWGAHSALRLGEGYWEVGASGGNAEGAEWGQVSTSLRMDVPIETLLGFAYVGIDVTHYKGVDEAKKIVGGGHVGGGIMTMISKLVWARADMKLNVKPGTSLYIGLGLVFRFGSEEGNK